MSDDEQDIISVPLYRQAPPTDLIFRDGDDPTLEGMVVPFNKWTEVDSIVEGHFMERFSPGSLTKTFSERLSRMRGFFDHGMSRMFERMPVMDIRDAWEQDDGAFFRASLLPSVPDLIKDGLRRGIYGVSLGAAVVNVQRTRRPGKSAHNPQGLEERTYTELRGKDISLTPTPHYQTNLVFRSITDDILLERLLEDPKRLIDAIVSRQEQPPAEEEPPAEPTEEEEGTTEPQHSVREEPEAPDPERSRSTQPHKDYLRPQKGEPEWLL